jgi:hypothetical protein
MISPSGRRTERRNRWVETLISIRFIAHWPSQSLFPFSRQEHRFETPPEIIERGMNSKKIKCYSLFNQSISSDRQGGLNWTPPELASTAGSSCVVGQTLSFYKQFRSALILSLMRSASFASAPHQMMRGFFICGSRHKPKIQL